MTTALGLKSYTILLTSTSWSKEMIRSYIWVQRSCCYNFILIAFFLVLFLCQSNAKPNTHIKKSLKSQTQNKNIDKIITEINLTLKVTLSFILPWYWALKPLSLWLPSEVKWRRSQFLLLMIGEGRLGPVNLWTGVTKMVTSFQTLVSFCCDHKLKKILEKKNMSHMFKKCF